MATTILTPDAIHILNCNHVKKDPNICWEWLGYRDSNGYGKIEYMINYKRTSYLAHRISYMYYNKIQELDSSIFICHSCDYSPCQNPRHLFLGNYQDNSDDKVAKGRQMRGEEHPLGKLTEEDIISIRLEAKLGKSHRAIAKQYGVCRQNIDYILNGKYWKHIK